MNSTFIGLIITMIVISVCAITAITLLMLNIRDLKLIIKMQSTELKIRDTGIRHLQEELRHTRQFTLDEVAKVRKNMEDKTV